MSNMIPNEFVRVDPPAEADGWAGFDALYRLTNFAFDVLIEQGRLIVNRREECFSECRFDVPEGSIIGISEGEFGGWLSLEQNEDVSKKPLLENEKDVLQKRGTYYPLPIVSIFEFEGMLLCLTGLNHMGYSHGSLLVITDYLSGEVSTCDLLHFEDAPDAYTVYQGKIYIAAAQSLLVVSQDFSFRHLFKDSFWLGLYPKSIVVLDEENIFLGIEGGIIRLNTATEEYELFIHESLLKKY